MSVGQALYDFFQQFILAYFVLVNVAYLLLSYIGLRSVLGYIRVLSSTALNPLLTHNTSTPISILVPAYNEELSIVNSVRSFLSLHYPVFEVIVVSDGSKDQTVQRLIDGYGLIETQHHAIHQRIPTKEIKRVFYSSQYPNLIVVEKANGGKADALNAAMNAAQYPLVCAVDADSVLDVEALLRAARLFQEDERVVAVGGMIHPLNGSVVEGGQVRSLGLPKSWIERVQIPEYSRAFFCGRAGWAAINALLIISGAFGVFRRDAVMEVGGYSTKTVCEDIDLVVQIHRHYRRRRQPYRIAFIPEPLCWTEIPSDLATLRRQRNRWHRGLWETLWTHRVMTFNPRYGMPGMVAMPYLWLVEAISPIIEVGGYVFLVVSYISGYLNVEFAFWFLLLAVLYGVLLTQMVVAIENLLIRRYDRTGDWLLLMTLGWFEFFGYRQIFVWERFRATFQVWRKRGQWGVMQRKGIS